MSVSESPKEEVAPAVQDRSWISALRFRDFRLLVLGSFLARLASQMLSVAVGWELYTRTNSPLALGLVGLVQIVPNLLLALPAGHIADSHDRKLIVVLATAAMAASIFALAVNTMGHGPLLAVYALLFAIGVGRAFQGPAVGALNAQVVPPSQYSNSATWLSATGQMAGILGPAFAGILVAVWSVVGVYSTMSVLLLLVVVLYATMRVRAAAPKREPLSLTSLLAGTQFIRHTPVILSAITLDMFAVLLGGATALMPIFARDILAVGAEGLGWLQSAPAVGALLAALVMTTRPPARRVGPALLVAVAAFGLVTVIFGLSRQFLLSLAMLAMLGALDNVSVVIRTTLVLTLTPNALRGRVNAVHSVFIGISNELGAFESGVAAAVLGAITAVVAGGIGTILVVALVAAKAPQLRHLDRIIKREQAE